MKLGIFFLVIGVLSSSLGIFQIWQRRRWHPEYEPVDPDWLRDLFIILFKNRFHQGSTTASGAYGLVVGIPMIFAGFWFIFE